MRITDSLTNFVDIRVQGYEPIVNLSYDLERVSSLRYVSIDRGTLADKYETQIETFGSESYIDEVYGILLDQRFNSDPIVLSDFALNKGEAVFGDNIDYTVAINCVVIDTPKKSNKSFNVYSLKFKLRALGLAFDGTQTFPTSLQCVWSGWSGGSKEWNRNINMSYYNDNFAVIKNNDDRKFIGKFICDITQSTNLAEFHRNKRGLAFNLNASAIGVAQPFGPDFIKTDYDVLITDLKFESFSPLYRQVTIELTNVGDLI